MQKSVHIAVRMDPAAYSRASMKARELGLNFSEYVRLLCSLEPDVVDASTDPTFRWDRANGTPVFSTNELSVFNGMLRKQGEDLDRARDLLSSVRNVAESADASELEPYLASIASFMEDIDQRICDLCFVLDDISRRGCVHGRNNN